MPAKDRPVKLDMTFGQAIRALTNPRPKRVDSGAREPADTGTTVPESDAPGSGDAPRR